MEIYNKEKLQNKIDNYEMIVREIKALADMPKVSIYASLASLIYNYIDNVSWAGVYLYDNDKKMLFVGPYQGKPACLNIKLGRGVCGSALLEEKTKIITDVREESNHIACDSNTLSEIVTPIIKDGNKIGVIDLDSYVISNYDEIDKKYLEIIAGLLGELK